MANTNRACDKCGSGWTQTRYDPTIDRLKLACENCGYSWYEPTMDQRTAVPEESDG